jgi:hypothetical protein
VVNDHILVLGWTDKTLFLLEELIKELADEDHVEEEEEVS